MKWRYDRSRCKHLVPADHITGRTPQGRAIWRCSSCGAEAAWATGWKYYGNVECKHCWQTDIERVLCPACADER